MKQTLNLEWAPATGMAAGTALGWSVIADGTVSHPALTSTNLQTQMRRTRFASKSGANASAGLISSDALCWRGNAASLGGFVFAARFSMSSNVEKSRAFVGLSSSSSSLMSTEPSVASVDAFGIGFDSTDPSGGNWILIRKNASMRVKEALGATTIASASSGLSLPQETINVVSTSGFPPVGTISVTTSAGVETVYYAGVTATSFTKCTGGTGAMSAGGAVALASTQIAAGSAGQSLPLATTINVASTAGFASSGIVYVTTSNGNQVVTYTGTTGTSFMGCAGGTGTMSAGGMVTASAAWRNISDVYDLTISAAPYGTQIVVSLMNLSTGTVVLNNVAYSSSLPANTAFLYAHAEIGAAAAGASTRLELAGMSLVEKRGSSLGTLEPLGGWYDVTDYGATGDGQWDDTAAINAAIRAAKNLVTWNGDHTAGGRVYFPPGRYRCAGQILIDGSVSLQGAKGEGAYPAVTLLFDENLTVPQNGLVRVKMGTSRTGGKTGGFLTISDIAVVQGRTAARDKLMTVAGILINAPFVQLHNVMVSQIQGHGIEITSSVTDVPRIDRNADSWLLSGQIRLSSNVGHGLYTHGEDSSAGASVGLIDARGNGGYGVYEDSFLGNYYAAIHTIGNGIWHADAVVTPHGDKWLCDAAALIYMDDVPNGHNGPIPSSSKPIWQPNSEITRGELCIPTWSRNTWFLYRATHVDPTNNRTHPTLEPTWPKTIGAVVPDGGIEWTCWRELGGAVSNGARSTSPGTLLSNNLTEYGSIYTEGDQNQVYLATPARVPESSPYRLDARSAPPKRASATNMPIEIQNPYAVGNHLDATKSHTFVGLGRWAFGNRTPVGIDPDVIFRWGANKLPSTPNDDAGVWLGDFLEHEFRYRGKVADGIYRYEQRWRTELDKAPGFQTWHSYQINGTRGAQLQPAAFIVPSLWIGNQMGPTHETRIGAVHSQAGKPYFANASLAGRGYFPSGSILFNKDYPTNGPIGWIAKEDCGVRMAGAQGLFQASRHFWAGLVCGVTDGGVWVALNQGRDPNASQTTFLALTSTPGATYSTGAINWKCVGTSSGNPNSWEDLGPTTSATSWSHVGNARRKEYENIANIQTSAATVTSLFTWAIPDEAVSTITAEVEAIKTDGSATASYIRRVRVKRDGGAVTVGTVDTTWTDEEAAFAGCDVTIDNIGSTGRVRVTGIAATPIDWSCKVRRSETTHTT
ncbi:glycoside hydrolase family 55 protein [Streptomyces yangpuensis]|uniref:Glycoside hydrolase family 55 protein n=1 Tax=Streptomyces yangpuensis TaxID=1648182 RepID=A0ABY5PSC6_9ACTN|nr:glycoside hydrolase family 55 protein [Streptomyces yangpuensis]UUY46355.1 glycoside hydrolase family 55 protein [Streptomyces yangpuensis]